MRYCRRLPRSMGGMLLSSTWALLVPMVPNGLYFDVNSSPGPISASTTSTTGRFGWRTSSSSSVVARSAAQPYDAIALDIDNGPSAMVQTGNAKVYDLRGIQRIAQALKPGGRVVIWSSGADKMFESRLSNSGFKVQALPVRKHATAKSTSYMIYIADKIVPPASKVAAETERPVEGGGKS